MRADRLHILTAPQAEILFSCEHLKTLEAHALHYCQLIDRSGIYLDIDTMCINPFHSLRFYEFVMGERKAKK